MIHIIKNSGKYIFVHIHTYIYFKGCNFWHLKDMLEQTTRGTLCQSLPIDEKKQESGNIHPLILYFLTFVEGVFTFFFIPQLGVVVWGVCYHIIKARCIVMNNELYFSILQCGIIVCSHGEGKRACLTSSLALFQFRAGIQLH